MPDSHSWDARLQRLGLWLIGLGACLRLAYLAQYLELPFADGPLFDAEVYLAQARAVSEGRFGDPTLLAFSPLYGYLLALLDAAHHPVLVLLVQLAMGTASLWLLWRTALHLDGALSAAFVVALWAGYGWVAFFETKLLSETFGMLLLVIAFCGYAGAGVRRAAPLASGLTGAAFALATLARASLIFCLPLVVLGAALMPPPSKARPHARWLRASWVAVGIATVVGANGLWTQHHSGQFVPVIMVSKTAAKSSRTAWDGSLSSLSAEPGARPSSWDVVRQARSRLASAPQAGDSVGDRGIDVLGWLQHVPGRLLSTFRNDETTHQYRYYGERRHLSALNLFPVTFGFIGLSALAGLAALYARRRLALLFTLAPVVAGTLVTTTLIMPSARYRLPLVVPLVVLGGIGLAWLARARQGWARAAQVALACALAALAADAMTHKLRHPGLWHVVLAEAAVAAGRPKEAERHLETALRDHGDDASVRRRISALVP